MTSNQSPERALGYISDDGLYSRLLAVPMEFKISEENIGIPSPFNLLQFLKDHTSELIHWALTTPEKLSLEARAEKLRYSGSQSCYGCNIFNASASASYAG